MKSYVASVENAMSLDIAMGGSTNTVLHLLAVATEAGVDFTMKDIDRLSRIVPHLCKVAPSTNQFHVSDVHRAGGVMGILAELDRAGLIHKNALHVSAPTIGELITKYDIKNNPSDDVKHLYLAAPGGQVNNQPFHQNEFFDSLYGSIDPSCSSGRLSRTYKIMYESVDVPEEYQYFKNEEYFPLYEPADFCPVNIKYEEEELKSYYVGHCSKVGTDLYGTLINYGIPSTDSTSKSFAPITGEELSDNSFCFISSLIISNHETADYKSNFYRANCHKIL